LLHQVGVFIYQLNVTECFIALLICSTCFGHFYAHHQELETMLEGCCTTESCSIPLPGRTACCPTPDPDNQQPSTAHHRRYV